MHIDIYVIRIKKNKYIFTILKAKCKRMQV